MAATVGVFDDPTPPAGTWTAGGTTCDTLPIGVMAIGGATPVAGTLVPPTAATTTVAPGDGLIGLTEFVAAELNTGGTTAGDAGITAGG